MNKLAYNFQKSQLDLLNCLPDGSMIGSCLEVKSSALLVRIVTA